MPLTPTQRATLRQQIEATPALLAPWQAGTPGPIADALNDPAGPYAGTVTLTSVPRPDMLRALRPALSTLPGLSSAIQAKWDRVLSWVRSSENVPIDALATGLFNSAVTDGVLTSAQAAACYQRPGSWAEVNLGAGAALSWQDVVDAMNP